MRIALLVLGVICLASHLPLLQPGLSLHDADQFLYPLAADHAVRFGDWSLFPFTQDYGGMTYTWLRALWAGVAEMLSHSPRAYITAHLTFSYLVSPLLLAISMYFLARAYCGTLAALFTGAVAASGFHYWVNLIGLDIYIILPILGAWIFWLRRDTLNPLLQFGRVKLFAVSVLIGLACYTFRPALIYLVAFFAPWHWLSGEVRRLARAQTKRDRFFKIAIAACLLLYAYIEVFGGNLGTVFGKPIRLAGKPNLEVALALFAAFLLSGHWREVRRDHVTRTAIALGGLLAGFLPQIYYWLTHGYVTKGWDHFGEPITWRATVAAFSELVLGHPERAPYTGILRQAPLVLLAGGIVALVRQVVRGEQRLVPFAAILVLNIVAFHQIHVTSPGATRYLFAVYPALIVAMAVFLERLLRRRLTWLAAALVVGASSYQAIQHRAWARSPETQARLELRHEVVRQFRALGVSHVWVDDYWHTLPYSFISREQPLFTSPIIPWGEPGHWKAPRQAKEVGVLLTGKARPDVSGNITFLGQRYRLRPLGQIQGLELYAGTLLD